MKYIICVLLLMFCVGCSKEEPQPKDLVKEEMICTSEPEKSASEWNEETLITEQQKSGLCKGYLSADGKSFWLTEYQLNKEEDIQTITLPTKVKGTVVIKIGAKDGGGTETITNVFGTTVWDAGDEYLKSEEVTHLGKIRTIVIPDTVEVIGECTFSGLVGLETIHLPENLSEMKICTWKCDNLKQMKLSDKNKRYKIEEDILIDKEKNAVLYILGDKDEVRIPEGIEAIDSMHIKHTIKKLYIPASVREIEDNALEMEVPMKIEVSKSNAVYHSKETCVYEKETGKLVAITIKDNAYQVADGVKDIPEVSEVSVLGDVSEVKKAYIPKSVERMSETSFEITDCEVPTLIMEGKEIQMY